MNKFLLMQTIQGQARKSLWIETCMLNSQGETVIGQARKSLWIETCVICST